MKPTVRIHFLAWMICISLVCAAQENERKSPEKIPTAVEWTIGAAPAAQKAVIESVFLLYCPKSHMKGTGFLLTSGVVVTNNHVVEGCSATEMLANPFPGQEIRFDKMAVDRNVDLAILHPAQSLKGGLELGSGDNPELGTEVNTWGFPLTYNGPAPLLSMGYVAGYVKDGADGQEVKHIVVNGAFNPGNSGGPLVRWKDNKVIGVVVAKFRLYPAYVENLITVLSKEQNGMQYSALDAQGNPAKDEQGKPIRYSEAQIVGAVLDQFYKTTQVMIGEAISVSEVRTFIKKHQAEIQ